MFYNIHMKKITSPKTINNVNTTTTTAHNTKIDNIWSITLSVFMAYTPLFYPDIAWPQ